VPAWSVEVLGFSITPIQVVYLCPHASAKMLKTSLLTAVVRV
jgi:hypothetical protein